MQLCKDLTPNHDTEISSILLFFFLISCCSRMSKNVREHVTFQNASNYGKARCFPVIFPGSSETRHYDPSGTDREINCKWELKKQNRQ